MQQKGNKTTVNDCYGEDVERICEVNSFYQKSDKSLLAENRYIVSSSDNNSTLNKKIWDDKKSIHGWKRGKL